jgi:hypothetical protein
MAFTLLKYDDIPEDAEGMRTDINNFRSRLNPYCLYLTRSFAVRRLLNRLFYFKYLYIVYFIKKIQSLYFKRKHFTN